MSTVPVVSRPPFILPPGACDDSCTTCTNCCLMNNNLYLSLHAYPPIVHQVGDVIRWYLRITNVSTKLIKYPGTYHIIINNEMISGKTDGIEPSGAFEISFNSTVTDDDMDRKFIVATAWLTDCHGCLNSNIVDASVAVTPIGGMGSVQFLNPTLLVNVTEDLYDIQVTIDIFNMSTLDVNSLILDMGVIFGRDTQLRYLVDGTASVLFNVDDGMLSLAAGNVLAAGTLIRLLVTNVDKNINLGGLCSGSCASLASWRLEGQATRETSLEWIGEGDEVTFENLSLSIVTSDNYYSIVASLDIINHSNANVNFLNINLSRIFGLDPGITYTVNGFASNIFDVNSGVLSASGQNVLSAGDHMQLVVKNTQQNTYMGFCIENCLTDAVWRVKGGNFTVAIIPWENIPQP